MPVEPEEFDQYSDWADEERSDEITRRVSVSRRYYYIFHELRNENQNHQDSRFGLSGSDHKEASSFLERQGHPRLAELFNKLRKKRNQADYDIEDNLRPITYMMFRGDLEDFEYDARAEGFIS